MIVKPPNPIPLDGQMKVFLAGSIEMGAAEDWQAEVAPRFEEAGVVVLSPRRDDFDPEARQVIEDDYFRGQVEWELDALERTNGILMHFCEGTKSPVTLLELGLYAKSGKLVVSCPEGYWRQGNVHILCVKYGIPFYRELDDAVAYLLHGG